MGKIYYDNNARIETVLDKVVAIIGYGNQGRAQALNMKDSGVKKIVVGTSRPEAYNTVNEDGFEVYSIAEASKLADIIFILIPDEVAPEVYENEIEPNLKDGDVLNFSSGYNISFGHIKPKSNIDVIMVAPRMIGNGVRETFVSGQGFPAFVVVEQDASGNAHDIALGLAKAIGSTKSGAIEVTFNDETYLDLMSEQAVWPLIMNVMTEVFNLLISKGHSPESILTELYLSKEAAIMMEKMADVGLFKQLPMHSRTSQYGQLSRYNQVDTTYIREFLEKQYNNIKNGRFAEEWEKVKENDLAEFNELLDGAYNSPISKAEEAVKKNLSGGNAEPSLA